MTKLYDAIAGAAIMEMKGEQSNAHLITDVNNSLEKASYTEETTLTQFEKTMHKSLKDAKIAGIIGGLAAGLGGLAGSMGSAIVQVGQQAPTIAKEIGKAKKDKVDAELDLQNAVQDQGADLTSKASKSEEKKQSIKNELLTAISKAINTRATACQG